MHLHSTLEFEFLHLHYLDLIDSEPEPSSTINDCKIQEGNRNEYKEISKGSKIRMVTIKRLSSKKLFFPLLKIQTPLSHPVETSKSSHPVKTSRFLVLSTGPQSLNPIHIVKALKINKVFITHFTLESKIRLYSLSHHIHFLSLL